MDNLVQIGGNDPEQGTDGCLSYSCTVVEQNTEIASEETRSEHKQNKVQYSERRLESSVVLKCSHNNKRHSFSRSNMSNNTDDTICSKSDTCPSDTAPCRDGSNSSLEEELEKPERRGSVFKTFCNIARKFSFKKKPRMNSSSSSTRHHGNSDSDEENDNYNDNYLLTEDESCQHKDVSSYCRNSKRRNIASRPENKVLEICGRTREDQFSKAPANFDEGYAERCGKSLSDDSSTESLDKYHGKVWHKPHELARLVAPYTALTIEPGFMTNNVLENESGITNNPLENASGITNNPSENASGITNDPVTLENAIGLQNSTVTLENASGITHCPLDNANGITHSLSENASGTHSTVQPGTSPEISKSIEETEHDSGIENDTKGNDINLDSFFSSCWQELCQSGWYWGPLTSKEAEDILYNKPDGTFLVRDSNNDMYILSLSYRTQNSTRHIRIQYSQGNFSFCTQPSSHGRICAPSVKALIECFQDANPSRCYICTVGRLQRHPLNLVQPVLRSEVVPSLQYFCRLVIRWNVWFDHIDELPLSRHMLWYLKTRNYFIED